MTNPASTPACGILYVDDEEKALKYFRMAFSSKYEVFTATSGAEGIEILRRESKKIGIVLSDQRMPNMLGAEFLGLAREEFPHIVRILTTAYSDLDSAIQAVNTGYIYQYVVKPWEITDLGMVLQRAADYFHVLSERNELLALKMTMLQRVLCSDRVKWLLLSARELDPAGQTAFRQALVSVIKALPESLHPAATQPGAFSRQQFEITELIRAELSNATKCLDALKEEAELSSSIEATRAALEAEGFADVTVGGDGGNAELNMPIGDRGKLAASIFSLLVEAKTTEASIQLFRAILAAAKTGSTVRILVNGEVAYVFSPQGEPNIDQVVGELYEKFSASDISRL